VENFGIAPYQAPAGARKLHTGSRTLKEASCITQCVPGHYADALYSGLGGSRSYTVNHAHILFVETPNELKNQGSCLWAHVSGAIVSYSLIDIVTPCANNIAPPLPFSPGPYYSHELESQMSHVSSVS